MACCHSERPCPAPPHPDLVARRRTELVAQSSSGATPRVFSVGAPSGNTPGLNDGTIFPEDYFQNVSSSSSHAKRAFAAPSRAPLRGSIRVAIVLAEFSDRRMSPGAKARFEELFFSTGRIPTGSVTEYYKEVSNGKISLTGEVVGPFMMPQTAVYYANSDHGLGSAFPNLRTLAADALNIADGKVDFKPYDNDGNGLVDAYILVHAGPGGEVTGNKNDIWSAQWVLPNVTTMDGVNLFAFLTIPEDAYIGVCAHELGHLIFNWPDLYDIDYSSTGIGSWCLMSGGSWGGFPAGTKPCHPSAWCKATQGWVDVVTETENRQITFPDVKSSQRVHKLWTNGDSSSQEYFLVENRQLTGFDASLPAGGLLVWHIDDSVPNNSDERHPKVALEQADGLNQLATNNSGRGDGGDPFPGTANTTAFTSTSNPSSKSYAGAETYVSITSIPTSSPSMITNVTVKPVPPVGFNGKTWYRFRNTLGGYALDVVNDGRGSKDGFIQMAREGNFSGQYWQIKPRGDGSYALCTMFLGANMQLDVYGDDKTKPHLATAGNYSGQYWQIKPWGDGTYFLTNSYSGSQLNLDTMEGATRVAMNSGNVGRPTQRWTITPIKEITESGFPATVDKSKL